VLMAIGLAQSFASTHRRLWARIGRGEVVLAGSTHRASPAFTQLFAQFVEAVEARAKSS